MAATVRDVKRNRLPPIRISAARDPFYLLYLAKNRLLFVSIVWCSVLGAGE